MNQGPKASGGRNIVAYFAGHLANLVNGSDTLDPIQDFADVKAFALYEKVRRTLAASGRYKEGLVGFWSYPPPNEAEDAADFYFDQVLQRPIGARKGEPTTADALCAMMVSHGLKAPAAGPGERSTWAALVGSGGRIRRFKPQEKLFELSNRILKCLDAANRPYAEVLRLGLCPKEWLTGDDAVGVNTLKSANSFLKALKAAMREEYGRRPTREELDAAFAKAPVPGYENAQDFVRKPFGAAVVARIAGLDQTYLTTFDAETHPLEEIEDENDTPLMTAEEAAPFLKEAVAAGAISGAEGDLLAAIMAGRDLMSALGDNLALRRRLKQEFNGDVGAYVDELSARTARFVAAAAGRP